MSAKKIARLLKRALLNNGKMEYALYEHELEEVLDELKSSMARDKDDYIFTVTENRGDVAMVLIEKSGAVYINEQARGNHSLPKMIDWHNNQDRYKLETCA